MSIMDVGKGLWTAANRAKYFSISYADYAIGLLNKKEGFDPYDRAAVNYLVQGLARNKERRLEEGRNSAFAFM